jgi:hypothetical protein
MNVKILQLLQLDSISKKKMIENGVARARQFSWKNCAKAKFEEIKKII